MSNESSHASTNRREFLKISAAAAASASLVGSAHAAGKEEIKIALIGCGGRGSGAAMNALEADERVRLVCAADVFSDRLNSSLTGLSQKFKDRVQVPEDQRFIGFDAFKKALQADVDYVILATPPHFRPEHLAAAIDAGKHVFMEKPVAVDAAGCRSVMASGDKAREKGLSIVAGTQRRHEQCYLETYKRVQDGAIGRPLAARCYWNMGQLWFKERDPKWSDMEWMIRDWVNWRWLSGDHICEQHVHNIDVINWFTSSDGTANHPIRAVGFGGRARRVTGDQYDYFAIDFEYADGFHLASYCRQVNGCDRNVTETIVGDKGETLTESGVCIIKGAQPWEMNTRSRRGPKQTNPYVQEHIDLIDSIVNGKGLNEANNIAISTLTAVMGRIAAYTGKPVTWEEVMDPNNSDPAFAPLGPKEYNWDVSLFPHDIPVAGRA